MLKKSFCALIVLLLFCAGAARAVEEEASGALLTPGDTTYDAGLAIEDAQYSLVGDPEEQVGMQNEYAGRRLQAMGQTDHPAELGVLLEGYRERERELWRLLEGLAGLEGKLGAVLALAVEACQQRELRLRELSENGALPAAARDGMKQALENQAMAMARLQQALTGAQQARDAARNRGDQENEAGKEAEASGPPEGVAPGPPAGVSPGPPAGVIPGPPAEAGKRR